MSVLERPPEARLPVRTYVTEYDDGLSRRRSCGANRQGGQVYFVNNRVQGIERPSPKPGYAAGPEARVVVATPDARGPASSSDDARLCEGDFDVLVCTTIIESGLGYPNANTLIVNSAHRSALAQLYRAARRVGRSASRSVRNLLFAKDIEPSEVAQERLKTISRRNRAWRRALRIAMKDLEIRELAILLGSAQSGTLAAVGFDLTPSCWPSSRAALKQPRRLSALPVDGRAFARSAPQRVHSRPTYVSTIPVRLRALPAFSRVSPRCAAGEPGSQKSKERFVWRCPRPAQHLVYLTMPAPEAGEATCAGP